MTSEQLVWCTMFSRIMFLFFSLTSSTDYVQQVGREKMTLRKQKRVGKDTLLRAERLLEDIKVVERLLRRMRCRDEKKEQLLEVSSNNDNRVICYGIYPADSHLSLSSSSPQWKHAHRYDTGGGSYMYIRTYIYIHT